jgi:hypothetical protein
MIEHVSVRHNSHPFFESPANSAQIWRYMDFTRFLSLIDNSALSFSRADSLSDAWEGAFPSKNVAQRTKAILTVEDGVASDSIAGLRALHRSLREHTFLSCWYMNAYESAGMWDLYASSNGGIAIQSTYERLTNCFTGDDNDMLDVYVGVIRYLDYDEDQILDGNTFIPFLHKRRSFEHERELRAVIQPIYPSGDALTESEPFAEGLLVDVDLTVLIENIFVSPNLPKWFVDLVKSVACKYEIKAPVRHSDLAQEPLF